MSWRDTVTGMFTKSRAKRTTVKETNERAEDHRILRQALVEADRRPYMAYIILHGAISRVLRR